MSRKILSPILPIFALILLFAACNGNEEYATLAAEPEYNEINLLEEESEGEPEEEPQAAIADEYEEYYTLPIDPWNPDNFIHLRQPQPLQYATHGEIALTHIEFISDNLYARMPFTYREKEAAIWIVEELLAMGYSWDNIEIQEFYLYDPFVENAVSGHPRDWVSIWGAEDFLLRNYSQNIILMVPGQSERKIIVGAHYDSISYAGASDNASGMGLLLESAQRLLYMDNYHTIIYVFFGAEEIGLTGARVYYSNLTQQERDNIVMMINADSLLEGEHLVYGVGYVDSAPQNPPLALAFFPVPIHQNEITETVSAVAQGVRENHDVQISTAPEIILAPTDHLVFAQHGHVVVNFFGAYSADYYEFEDWAIARYEDYALTFQLLHTPRDDFHYINENWPYKMGETMRTFSLLLEALLLAEY